MLVRATKSCADRPDAPLSQNQFDTIDLSDNEIVKIEVRAVRKADPSRESTQFQNFDCERIQQCFQHEPGFLSLHIPSIEGFPPLKRLRTLYLNNNRIARIAPNLQGEQHSTERAWPSVIARPHSIHFLSKKTSQKERLLSLLTSLYWTLRWVIHPTLVLCQSLSCCVESTRLELTQPAQK